MPNLFKLFCRHKFEFVRNIYGDEITEWGWKRSIWRCLKCGKLEGRAEMEAERGKNDD